MPPPINIDPTYNPGFYFLSNSDATVQKDPLSANGHELWRSGVSRNTGKWLVYTRLDLIPVAGDNDGLLVGVVTASSPMNTYPGSQPDSYGVQYSRLSGVGWYNNGVFTNLSTTPPFNGQGTNTGDYFCMAFDMDAGKAWAGLRLGSSGSVPIFTGNPVTGADPTFTFPPNTTFYFAGTSFYPGCITTEYFLTIDSPIPGVAGYAFWSDGIGPTPTVVPNVVGELLAAATTTLAGAGLFPGAITTTYAPTIISTILAQNPLGGTPALTGSVVDLVESLGILVPNIVGLSVASATTLLTSVGLTVGVVTSAHSSMVPAGAIISQLPGAGIGVNPGTAVRFVVSLGAAGVIVPDIIGMTAANANTAIALAGLKVGTITSVVLDTIPVGDVATQSPLGGTVVSGGSTVDYVVCVFIEPFDVDVTVISPYANSLTLIALVEDMAESIDPRTNFEQFYLFVWNVDTAQGFGLDILGRIVNISRLLHIPSNILNFGFEDALTPSDYAPFNNAPFNSKGSTVTQTYLLLDDAYRVLILAKALANISAMNARSLNTLLRNLFPGRGRCYVLDLGGMAMQYTFEFPLTAVELAILTQSGALPHPAGVQVNVVSLSTIGDFGFAEAGDPALPFNDGVFYNP